MKLRNLLYLVLFYPFVFSPSTMINAQEITIPSDVVYTVEINDQPSLALLEAESLETRLLYTESNLASINAVSWSPDGSRLAVVLLHEEIKMEEGQRPRSLCILSYSAELQVCSQDPPPSQRTEYWTMFSEIVDVTWSPDGSKLYFPTENGITRTLIEVDAYTGETLRTIYSIDYIPNQIDGEVVWYPPIFSWTDDLQFLLVGVGYSNQTDRLLVRLQTQATTTLQKILESELPEAGITNDPNSGRVCPDISPSDEYFAIVESQQGNENGHLYLFSMSGSLVADINLGTDSSELQFVCPIWHPDGDSVFIFVSSNQQPRSSFDIYEYSLTEQSSSLLYENWSIPIGSISPDGTMLTFDFQPQLTALKDGELVTFGEIYTMQNTITSIVWRPIQ